MVSKSADDLFEERLNRIKKALGVKTDVELGRKMNKKSQQAISYARKHKKIPTTWLKELTAFGISADYILYDLEGPSSERKTGYKATDRVLFTNPSSENPDRISPDKEISTAEKSQGEQYTDLELSIAAQIIQITENRTGIQLQAYEADILKVFILQRVLPDGLNQVIGLLNKIKEI
jgi:hypothetical protein